jgi:uncharacterized protein (TIGR00730 family)
MTRKLERICVFTGSSVGAHPEYRAQARALGQVLTRRGIELVYGGGAVGLMGVIADEVLSRGGRAHGIIPQALASKEVAHPSLTNITVVDSMHARKQRMSDLASAFIAMPGGFGTFDELFEIITWAQLGIHDKPIGLLNVAGYFDALLKMIEVAINQGFIPPQHEKLLVLETDPDALVSALESHVMPQRKRWVTPEQS